MADELKLPTDPDAQRCLKCGKDALDTGWECTECGYDNMPWYRPQVAQQRGGRADGFAAKRQEGE